MASALSLAPMTVRQHLSVLEKDLLVGYKEVRRGSGRPHFMYALTPRAEELFPKGYYRLADRLLKEVRDLQASELQDLSEQEKLDLVFNKMADRIAAMYVDNTKGATLQERIETVTKVLREHEDTLSEWCETEDGFQIQDYNCPYYKIAVEESRVCKWHTRLLSKMLQADIKLEQCMATGSFRCCYTITEASPGEVSAQQF